MNKLNQPEYNIRALETDADYTACVRMQRETWGEDFSEFVPTGIIKIIQKVGGVAAGAFDGDGHMTGFVLGISGVRHGRNGHWSHMLAVDPAVRDCGLGRRLKEYQREFLVALGICDMYWTFDPLVARNANLNLNKLGTEIDEYARSMYGEGDRGKLDAVIGTDRFITSWDLKDALPRVPAHFTDATQACNSTLDGSTPHPSPIVCDPDPEIRIEIPQDIQSLKVSDPDEAAAWRFNTREAFEWALTDGYRVVGFGRSESGRCAYKLAKGTDL